MQGTNAQEENQHRWRWDERAAHVNHNARPIAVAANSDPKGHPGGQSLTVGPHRHRQQRDLKFRVTDSRSRKAVHQRETQPFAIMQELRHTW